MIKILEDLGFKCKKENFWNWLFVLRPDISREIDIVEELVRISGLIK